MSHFIIGIKPEYCRFQVPMDNRQKGRKRIPIAGHGDKRQTTAVKYGALTGEILSIQLVYKVKTKRCHPPYDFPADWMISHSSNYWSSEDTMIQ